MRRVESSVRGFTLLEVLVALVVLALALVALTETAGGETDAFRQLRDRTEAGWVAANTLSEVRLRPGLPALGNEDGRTTLAGREWRYRVRVDATPAEGIRRVHVDVFDPAERANPNATALVTLDGFASNGLTP